MITNEHIQYITYFIMIVLIFRIVTNGVDLANLKDIKAELINQ